MSEGDFEGFSTVHGLTGEDFVFGLSFDGAGLGVSGEGVGVFASYVDGFCGVGEPEDVGEAVLLSGGLVADDFDGASEGVDGRAGDGVGLLHHLAGEIDFGIGLGGFDGDGSVGVNGLDGGAGFAGKGDGLAVEVDDGVDSGCVGLSDGDVEFEGDGLEGERRGRDCTETDESDESERFFHM